MEKTIDDKELGPIVVRKNLLAKHYSIRIVEGVVIATIPKRGTENEMLTFIENKRDRLRKMMERNRKRPVLNEYCAIKTSSFEVHIFRTRRTNIYVSLRDGILHIACPEDIDFDDERIQKMLWSIFTKVVKAEAVRLLPSRLEMIAAQHGFQYAGVTIRNTKTRWGSCNSKQQINLSSFLMLLPDHLINYVILHELCHTVEMNHGIRFNDLMDKVTDNCAQKLRKELREVGIW